MNFQALEELAASIGLRGACRALCACPASAYRRRGPPAPAQPPKPRPRPPGALREPERQEIFQILYSERFVDSSPAAVWATLLEEGRYLASERTLYRLLSARGQSRERRRQLAHPPYAKPELLARRPNELWSWDVTKLKGPAKWRHFHLYVILDVFSRYVVGWCVAEQESAQIAKALKDAVLPPVMAYIHKREPSPTPGAERVRYENSL